MSVDSSWKVWMLPGRFDHAVRKGDLDGALAVIQDLHELAVQAVLYDAPVVSGYIGEAATKILDSEGMREVERTNPTVRFELADHAGRAADEADRRRSLPPPTMEMSGQHLWVLEVLAEATEPQRDYNLAAEMGMRAHFPGQWADELAKAGLVDPAIAFKTGKYVITPRGRQLLEAKQASAPLQPR